MLLRGEENVAGAVGNLNQLAGNPFGPQFQIPQRGIRGMTPAQIQELKDWDPSSAGEIERIYRNIQPGGPQLFPRAGVMENMGNVGGVLFAQAQPTPIPGAKYTLKQLIGGRPGGMSDIPGDVRFRGDTQFLPYDPGNYAQNNRQNPLRGNSWAGPFDPRGYIGPGIAPYFGNRQGPGLYGEMGTGAI